MAKAKKKLLPKDFDALLKNGDVEALKSIFKTCDVNARGSYAKHTAIAFNDCPDELVRWLIDEGADISAEDNYGETPLHARAGHWQGRIEILLELGANVNHQAGGRGTPLHRAAAVGNSKTVALLLEYRADPNITNAEGLTALANALRQCHNAKIVEMLAVAEILVGTISTEPEPSKSFISRILGNRTQTHKKAIDYKALVTKIGETFEFHRDGYNPEHVGEASDALDKLYSLFDVTPVPRRVNYDGKSPIVAKAQKWEDQHQELWELLVPSSGAASTVQGEAIRISGRLHIEIYHNGSGNWDREFRNMANGFLDLVAMGTSLPDEEISKAKEIVALLPKTDDETSDLCKLAVDWVRLNPNPITLSLPKYQR